MTFSARFPYEYLRLDFFANLGIFAFDVAFLAFLLWDLVDSRRAAHLLLRIGTVAMITGILYYRVYLIWALWHFHSRTLTHERISADAYAITANLVFVACWVGDHVLTKRRAAHAASSPSYSLDPPNAAGDITFRENVKHHMNDSAS